MDEERIRRIERNQEADAIRINRVQSDLHTLFRVKGVDRYNAGDWTTLETVEIDDMVGGVKIENITQRDFLRITGKILKKM